MHLNTRAIAAWLFLVGVGISLSVTLSACSPRAAPEPAAGAAPTAAPADPQFHLTATIHDLMEGEVDPAADALWDSVAYIATTAGVEDRRPRTDAEWHAVRLQAITLIEATNLLSMPGRRVGGEDEPVGLGELTKPEIQQRIDATHASFVQFAQILQGAALQALAAIDAKNAQGLMDAGGTLDEACETCHVTYWYPNQSRRPT
jgi:hypothetical protein